MNDARRFSEDSMFVKDEEEYRRIEFSDILYIEANGSNTIIHMKDSELSLPYHLREIESFISDTTFLRVHRSYIINKQYISRLLGNELCIGNALIPLSISYRDVFSSSFKILGFRKKIKN